jgi:hypothetical protein
VRDVTGVGFARLLEADLEVVRERPSHAGPAAGIKPGAVIELDPPLCLVRLDEEWWTGLLMRRSGEVVPEVPQGPDLEAALRRVRPW